MRNGLSNINKNVKVAALVTGSTLLVMLLALAEFFHLVGTRLRHDECCDEKITAVPVDSLDSLQQNHCQRIAITTQTER